MAFIGSLITTVKANTGPFRKNMKKAGKRAQKFKKQLKGLALGGAKFGAVLGGVAVAALVAYTIKAFKAIDATKKLADELEIATSDLISYQLAAGLSGTNTETLNKALQRMARTVGEARSGITTGTKALEDFGIKVEDLKGLSTAQIFETFAQKISEIPDPLERAAKSALIFGKAGQKLLNFLSLGKDGLAAVKLETEKLGLAFDEVDARKVEEANDAILRMTTVADGLGNTLAISVAPFLTAVAEKMTDFIKESGGIDVLVKGALRDLVGIIGAVGDQIILGAAAWNLFSGAARVAISVIMTPLANLESGLVSIANTLGKKPRKGGKGFQARLIGISKALDKLAKEDIARAEKAFRDFDNKVASNKLKSALDAISDKSKEIAKRIEEAKNQMTGFTDISKEQAKIAAESVKIEKERVKDFEKVLEAANRVFEETRTPLEDIESEITRIMELFRAGGFEGIEDAFDRKLKELEDERKAIEDAFAKSEKGKQDKAAEEAAAFAREREQEFFEKFGFGPGGLGEGLGEAEKKKEREAGFRQIDTRNIDIAGLAKFGDEGNIDRKQLTEAEKQTALLEDIAKARQEEENTAVAG